MASQQVDVYSLATPATGDTFIGIDVSDTTDSVNGTVKQFAFTDLQPRDATLTSLAAFNTNGVLVQTAADTFVGRTLTGTSSRITVTNGDGVSGAPTFDISASYVGQTSITTLGTIATGTWGATTITVDKGGTGLTSYAVGDLLYASGATTLAKLADIATGNVLISGGVTTAPSWGQVGLTTHVIGVLPSANGGTGVNNAGTITNASNTTITGGGTLALGGFTLTVPATLTVAGLAIANAFTAAQSITIDDSATNATTTLLTLDHSSSGTVAASFGTRLLFNLESTTTLSRNAAAIDVIWATATDASRDSNIRFFVATNGGGVTTEAMRLDSLGLSFIAGNSATRLGNNLLTLSNFGGPVTLSNAQTAANTTMILKPASGISTGQYLSVQFGAVETAQLVVAPAAASTNAVVDNLILRRNPTSGTPAVGTGQQIHFVGKTSTTADRDQLTISTEWVVATEASQTTRAKLSVYDTAARVALTIEASGSAAMIGFLGAAAAAQQTGGANVTNNVTSGGTSDTIANYTDLTVYANDATAIRNDIYQLARLVKQDHDALRLYGLLT